MEQVKREVIEKTSQGASDGRYKMVSVSKCCMMQGRSLSGNVRGRGLGAPSYPMKRFLVDIYPLNCVVYETEACMVSASCFCTFCFNFWLRI